MFFGSPFAPSPYGEAVPVNLTNKDRLVVDGKAYDIVYVDNPMNLGKHLEIYLKESDYV
jgi:head-tail adaptor